MNVLKCHTQIESTSEEATLFQIFVYKCDIGKSTISAQQCYHIYANKKRFMVWLTTFSYCAFLENPACDKSKRFVFREDFTEHLQECAPIGHELFPCHLCKSSYPLDRLIEVYPNSILNFIE